MKIKLNLDMNNKKKDDTVILSMKNGVIMDKYWRRRVVDSKIDNCVSIIGKGETEPKEEKKDIKSKKKEGK